MKFLQTIEAAGGIVALIHSGNPENSKIGSVGQHCRNTINDDIYFKSSGNNTATGWKLITGGGGSSSSIPPKVTTYSAGSYYFTPASGAVATKIQMQAAGGGGSVTSGVGASLGCSAAAGAGGGNYYEALVNQAFSVSSIYITVPSAVQPPSSTGDGATGGSCTFGSYLAITGGGGSRQTTGGYLALIYQSHAPNSSVINWGNINVTEILNKIGQEGGSPFVPIYNANSLIVGGRGGDSHWGFGSGSEAAIYNGASNPRVGYVSVQRAVQGYGGGGAGAAVGNRTATAGTAGGAGRLVITEFF